MRSDLSCDSLEAIGALVAEAESLIDLQALLVDVDGLTATDIEDMANMLWIFKNSYGHEDRSCNTRKTHRPKFTRADDVVAKYLDVKRKRDQEQYDASAKRLKDLNAFFKLRPNPRADTCTVPSTDATHTLEAKRTLRAMGWPITLFGETDADRARRLRDLQLNVDDDRERGEFNVLEREMRREAKGESGELDSEPEGSGDSFEVLGWIRMMFQLWLKKISKLTAHQEEKGKYRQATQYIRPLRKLLRTETLDEDILQRLVRIARLTRANEHIEAEAEYVKLAIGNAAWPVGVTGTSIHARPAESKIRESEQAAHILNDETSRKYLQTVKRLITLAKEVDETTKG